MLSVAVRRDHTGELRPHLPRGAQTGAERLSLAAVDRMPHDRTAEPGTAVKRLPRGAAVVDDDNAVRPQPDELLRQFGQRAVRVEGRDEYGDVHAGLPRHSSNSDTNSVRGTVNVFPFR